MKYGNYLIYGYIGLSVLLALILILFSFYIIYFKASSKKDTPLPLAKTNYKYIILIPARNESNVIKNILTCLKNQSYDKNLFDVFVITEDLSDPSNKIAKTFGFNYIVRKDLANKHTKGFALQEGYNYLIENNIEFDSLLIFDADNLIDKDYLFEINKLKNLGYQMGVGKRMSTNQNKTYISASSSLLFAFQSEFTNKARTSLFQKFSVSGTGYYIDKSILIDAGGWIFLGLTEDVELTRYAYLHGIKMGYNAYAYFYDEQPLDYKTMHNQHLRWIWGYFNRDSYKILQNKSTSYSKTPLLAKIEYVFAMGLFISTEVAFALNLFYFLVMSIIAFCNTNFNYGLIFLLLAFLDIIIMFLICSLANIIEYLIIRKKINFSHKGKKYIFLTGFIFWSDFFFAFLDGLFNPSKRHLWVTIKHQGNEYFNNN